MSRFFVLGTACLAMALGTFASAMAGEQLRQRPDRPGSTDRQPGDRDRPGSGDRPGPGARPGDEDRRYGPGDWELIGSAEIAPRIERQTINVDRDAGRFGRLGLQVETSDIEVIELEVEYGDGETETVSVRTVVKAGGRTPAYELRGANRRIRDVTVSYRARGPAELSVFGEPLRTSRPGARWEALGCQKVGFLDDTDVIRVGLREGRFRAIKLAVDGNKVRLVRLRVVYGNGQAEDLAVRTVIPEGTETRPFELTGRRRGIDRIELQYLPQLNFGGRATVCAYGM